MKQPIFIHFLCKDLERTIIQAVPIGESTLAVGTIVEEQDFPGKFNEDVWFP